MAKAPGTGRPNPEKRGARGSAPQERETKGGPTFCDLESGLRGKHKEKPQCPVRETGTVPPVTILRGIVQQSCQSWDNINYKNIGMVYMGSGNRREEHPIIVRLLSHNRTIGENGRRRTAAAPRRGKPVPHRFGAYRKNTDAMDGPLFRKAFPLFRQKCRPSPMTTSDGIELR